jgi:purine-binding chemotaxis protein CheW
METTVVVQPRAAASSTRQNSSNKHLIFSLGSEEFGIQVLNVKEIIGMQEITVVPQMPQHIKGVINLRGQVIPVVDLSLKLSLTTEKYTDRTCIIVLRTDTLQGERLIGAIIDGVSEVLTIAPEEIETSPDFGSDNTVPYLVGMAKVRGAVKLLLDINVAFSPENLLKIGTL